MTPPDRLVAGYSWRPIADGDIHAVAAVFNAANEHRGTSERKSPATMAHELASPGIDLARDTMLAVTADGALAGFGVVWHLPALDVEQRIYVSQSVHPDHAGHGLEDAITDWCVATAEDRLGSLDDRLPHIVFGQVPESAAEDVARLEARGFVPVRYFWDMERGLGEESRPDATLAAGPAGAVRIVPWDEGRGGEVRMVHNAAFADHWGSHPIAEGAWLHMLDATGFRPDLSFLALEDDAIVGYVFNEVYEEDWEAAGRREGWIGILGVRRESRHRGIATALLRRSFAAMSAAGLECAMIGVDSESRTGAHRLYESVGFEVREQAVRLHKEVG